MIGWIEDTIKNLTIKIGSGATPRGGENSYKTSGISLIRSQNIYDYKFKYDGLAYIDEKQAKALDNVSINPNDILLNITGDSIGRCCMVPLDVIPARVNQHVIIIRNNDKINARFLLYYINNPKNKIELLQRVHGGTRKAFTKGIIEDYKVTYPPLPIQQRIAEILGALDDKIECNRRINETLEKMAMALYKHWFVDFGPFRDGEFEETELGMVPKGWKVSPILDHCTLLSGGTPKTSVPEYWDGNIHWVTAKDLSQNGHTFIINTERKITPLGVEKSATKLLPMYTTVISARGSVGKFAILGSEMAMNQTCYGLKGESEASYSWVYLMVASLIKTLQQVAYGTVFDTITTATFERMKIVIPTLNIKNQFYKNANAIFACILVNIKENQLLSQTRDYLLPRLLSGEIEVKAAEKQVSEVI